MLSQSTQTRWNSVFLRWRLRRAVLLAVAIRLMLSGLLLYANGMLADQLPYADGESRSPLFTLTGIDTSLYAIALTIAATMIDMRRSGARDLMANLGYSREVLVSLIAIPPALLEIGIQVAVALA